MQSNTQLNNKNIHFMYIGDPPDVQNALEKVSGCLQIINAQLKCFPETVFHFWVTNEEHVYKWKQLLDIIKSNKKYAIKVFYNQSLNYSTYSKSIKHKAIPKLLESIKTLPKKILSELPRFDHRILINEPLKRNILKKDFCSIAVLKEYGGYYLDNNIYPMIDNLSKLNFDENVDFKAPKLSNNLIILDIQESEFLYRLRRYSLARLDHTEDETNSERLFVPQAECWALFSVKEGSEIESIYHKYLCNFEKFKRILDKDADKFLNSDYLKFFLNEKFGIGRVIINSILSSIIEDGTVDELYFWNTKPFDGGACVETKNIRKYYSNSWR